MTAWIAPGLRYVVKVGPVSISIERMCQIGGLGVAALVGVRAWRRGASWPARVVPVLGAGLLAGALAAVQVLPAAENVVGSTRLGDRLDRYGFSLVPYRVVEVFAPGALGQPYNENHTWRYVLPPALDPTFWVASLYLGGLTLALGLGALLGPRTRGTRWLAAATAFALVASFGLYASPSGIGRWLPALTGAFPVPRVTPGSLSETDFLAGDGSPFYVLNLLVPGLGLFRYPSKIFTWFAFGACVLAAFEWDRLAEVGTRRLLGVVLGLAALAGGLLALVVLLRGPVIAWGQRVGTPSQGSGPFQATAAWVALRNALAHSAVLFACFAGVLRIRAVRPRLSSALAVLLACVDLALANHALVWTVPQAIFDEPSEVATLLAADREEQPGPPVRIHRQTVWYPFGWFSTGSPQRLEEQARWERQTLQPLHGLPANVAYTLTLGIMEPPRYLALFRPWLLPVGPTLGPVLGLEPAEQVLHYPRRAFDLWATEYFLLPVDPAGWRDSSRGYASFLDRTQLIAPDAATISDPRSSDAWRRNSDWRLLRNLAAYPRAWIVHQIQVIPNLDDLDESQRLVRIRTLLFENDAIWNDSERPVVDTREVAWIESGDPARDRPRLQSLQANAAESVEFRRFAPDRVELVATLESRGLVVLAETDAPGWTAEIDGKPERIWRANLGMRGVVVPSGTHRLVFRYDPASARFGAILSLAATCVIAGLLVRRVRAGWKRLA
jgi:hypothetical protein